MSYELWVWSHPAAVRSACPEANGGKSDLWCHRFHYPPLWPENLESPIPPVLPETHTHTHKWTIYTQVMSQITYYTYTMHFYTKQPELLMPVAVMRWLYQSPIGSFISKAGLISPYCPLQFLPHIAIWVHRFCKSKSLTICTMNHTV